MFLAVIAFTISSFRQYIMFNHQHLAEDDNEEDEETSRSCSYCVVLLRTSITHAGSSSVLDKIRSIVTYVCTYLWAISFILLIFIIYASIRGPFNVMNSFNTGKLSISSHFVFSQVHSLIR